MHCSGAPGEMLIGRAKRRHSAFMYLLLKDVLILRVTKHNPRLVLAVIHFLAYTATKQLPVGLVTITLRARNGPGMGYKMRARTGRVQHTYATSLN